MGRSLASQAGFIVLVAIVLVDDLMHSFSNIRTIGLRLKRGQSRSVVQRESSIFLSGNDLF